MSDYESGGCGFDSCLARHLNREIAQLGSASDLGSEGRRFESCFPDHVITSGLYILLYIFYGAVAHLGEHLICTQEVASSILVSSTIKYCLNSNVPLNNSCQMTTFFIAIFYLILL